MAGTAAGAAKRERCPACKAWRHPGECGKPGPKAWQTPEGTRARKARNIAAARVRDPDTDRESKRRYRQRVRLRVLTHYSGGAPCCACCGEDRLPFLTLDHHDGDGAVKRRAAKSRGGISYYLLLIREGYPAGYRVLCWNCNCAIGLYGTCPHDEGR